MTSQHPKQAAILEEFAEACTTAARMLSNDRSLSWETSKDGFIHYHCPLPGLRGPHEWNGGPRASAWLKGGNIQAYCAKCVGSKNDYPDQENYETARSSYTEQVKRAIRWEQDGVIHAAFKVTVLRSHLYFDRDFKHGVRRDKIRFDDGRKERGNTNPWRWRSADLSSTGTLGQFSSMRAEEWLTKHYPEHDKIYDALCWYGIDLFIDSSAAVALTAATCQFKASYRVILTEGEKDADSFNALMAAAGQDGIHATCLCHPKPGKLASHHTRLIEGRDVVVVGDADEPGRQHSENWTTLLWDHAKSIKLIREQLNLAGTPEEKDLTDWIVKRLGAPPDGGDLIEWIAKAPYAKTVADDLLSLFAATAPLVEPLGHPTEWRTGMIQTQKGAAKADSPHNARRVWTMHQALKGKVRTNLRSGEVEIVDPPWGGGMTIGARPAAMACADWLESTEKMSLSTRMLEDMLALDSVAPPYNPLEDELEVAWDGTPRIDGLFTRYVPLNVEQPVAVSLARILIGDLVAKMRGEYHAQRVVVGIGTDYPLDLAGALMGRHGVGHNGRLTDKHVEQYARHEAAIVQITMEPIANRQAALVSVPTIFAKHFLAKQRLLSLPLFIAVGMLPSDPRTDAKVSERCFLYDLMDEPRMDLLQAEASQILAEGVVRCEELLAEPIPDKSATMTIDARQAVEMARHTLTGIWLYATRDVSAVDFGSSKALSMAPLRPEPLRHIVREQFLQAMRLWMYDAYRDIHAQEAAFNSSCRVMGWVKKGAPVAVKLTRNTAGKICYDIHGKEIATAPGVLLTEERLADLDEKLLPSKNFHTFDDFHSVSTPPNTAENKGFHSSMEAYYAREEKIDKIATPRAYVHGESSNRKRDRLWLDGEAAINSSRLILSRPGVVAIDFEGYPTAASWHGDEAAANAPHGEKGPAREAAVKAARLAGRARQRQACTLQLRHEDGQEVFCRLTDPMTELPAMFAPVVEQPPWEDGVTLVAHNAQYETEVLLKHGVRVDVEDTMLAAKALYLTAVPEDDPQPQSFSLAALVEREFGRVRDKTIRERDWRLEESLDPEAVEYGLQDVRDCLELWQLYRARLVEEGLWEGYEVIARAILPTAGLNLTGLTLDTEAHKALMVTMRQAANDLEHDLDRICAEAIENHGSTQQISDWIMGVVLGDSPVLPAGGSRTADDGQPGSSGPEASVVASGGSQELLEGKAERLSRFVMRLAARTEGVCKGWRTTKTGHLAITKGSKIRKAEQLHEAFPQISEYLLTHARWNKATKLLDSFGDPLLQYQDEDGRVRGQMKLGGTVTLRHSCVDPNLQQQPAEKNYRALWVAPKGRRFGIADYSQIELRLLAIVAKDERLREVYREGRDVHQETADIAGLPERKPAKGVNFLISYGGGAAGLSENLGFSLDHARAVIAKVLGAYDGLGRFREQAPQQARQQGYIAIRPHRRIVFVDGSSPATTCINYPIQGGAASVQMRALRLIDDALHERPDLDSFVAASVHDEFLLETPDDDARAAEAAEIMVTCMAQALLEIFPEAEEMGVSRLSEAKICKTWAEKD